MFKELGQLAGLMKNLPKIKEDLERLQTRLAQITAEGDAGGGMVKVRVNGKMEVIACSLSDDALRSGDREMLEELIKAAMNQALARARQQTADEARKMAADMNLPTGLNLSDLQLPGL